MVEWGWMLWTNSAMDICLAHSEGFDLQNTEYPKVGFNFLVDPFCFSIGLRVVC